MKTYLDCFPCFLNQSLECARMSTEDVKVHKSILNEVMSILSRLDYDTSPPSIAREVYEMIGEKTSDPDPYRKIKENDNRDMLKIYDHLKELVDQSEEPLLQACKLSIAGNQIDSGAGKRKENHDHKDIKKVLKKKPVIDHFSEFKKKLGEAGTLLYIGDNSGEIVLDKLFIREIQNDFKDINIIYTVRGKPVINDVTYKDARQIGMGEVCKVIDNGDRAPGTVLDYCSDEFKDYFYRADLVIAKGQGNYETLSDVDRKNLYFMLMAKCPVIAGHLNCDTGNMVIKDRSI
ncbi:MAG: damage-control phosphatase ARMT1 family protein [Elusimicrobiota bacterium]